MSARLMDFAIFGMGKEGVIYIPYLQGSKLLDPNMNNAFRYEFTEDCVVDRRFVAFGGQSSMMIRNSKPIYNLP